MEGLVTLAAFATEDAPKISRSAKILQKQWIFESSMSISSIVAFLLEAFRMCLIPMQGYATPISLVRYSDVNAFRLDPCPLLY